MLDLIAVLDWANLVAYVGVGVVAGAQAVRKRTRAGIALAAVFGFLALVALFQEFGPDPDSGLGIAAALVGFAGAGYAVLEHRASVLPLRPEWRIVVAAALAASAAWVLGAWSATGEVPRAPALAFVVVWGGCVLGPALGFWRATRAAAPVQRAQLRLLVTAYVGLVLVLLVAVVFGGEQASPGFQVATGVFTLLLVPGVYLAIEPPAVVRRWWLRRRARSRGQELNPIGTWYLDLDGEETWWSPMMREMLGLGPEDEAGPDVFFGDIVHEEDVDRIEEAFADIVASARRTQVDFRVVRRDDGDIRWIEGRADALSEVGREEATALFGTLRDITQQKRSEEQLARALAQERAATEELRRLDELKNTFMSAVSHELRTPLTALMGFAETLRTRRAEIDGDFEEELLGRISENARRLQHLLSDLLDLNRLSRGTVEPQRSRIDVGRLVEEVVAEVDLEGHPVHLDLSPSVTATIESAQIERVVRNLVANAVRHTSEGTPIWVRVAPWNDDVHVVVEDAGSGIPDDLKEAVFEPFRHGAESPPRGTGIGLAIVAEFAALHGGRTWVTDRPGGGASFHVALPREPGNGTGTPSSERNGTDGLPGSAR